MNILSSINKALDLALGANENLLMIGEDLADPYGGAFKVTRGLTQKYPGQVLSMPISEQAISGIAAGYALSGETIIVEIMFADFMFLCMDQIVNHVSKFTEMYGRDLKLPIIFRTPCGGGRGYGPTHSQSIEKYFINIPNIAAYYLSALSNVQELYRFVLSKQQPAIIFEHKLLYAQEIYTRDRLLKMGITCQTEGVVGVETFYLSMVEPEKCNFTILTYGAGVPSLIELMHDLAIEQDVFINLVVYTDLKAEPTDALINIIKSTQNIITVEESLDGGTWGQLFQYKIFTKCKSSIESSKAFTSQCNVIPASLDLERESLIRISDVKTYIIEELK